MELVQGLPITEYCDAQRLSTEERLKLFVVACKAVQHAHLKGVIHRDLKPSNILVPMIDGQAVPKVIDFGVAKAIGQKLTAQTVYTQFSQFVGTPMYMSPEQAELGVVDVDTRTDVYSLGVLLYELLTGSTPFDSMQTAGLDEVRRIIREEEPRRPSAKVSTLKADALSTVSERRGIQPRQLRDAFRGELDWIVMTALEKDRERRYESASALANDIERYLTKQPISARPPSTIYRFRKFVQRNKVRLVPAGLATALLLIGLTFAAFAVISERAEKEKVLHDTARRLYVSQVRQAASAWGQHDYGTLNEFLRNATPNDRSTDFRGWEWYYLHEQSRRFFAEIPTDQVILAAWRPNHNHLAVCVPRGDRFSVEYWKPGSSARLRELIRLSNPWPHIIRWSDDGARLAIGTREGCVTVVDATTGEVMFQRFAYHDDDDFDGMEAIDLSSKGDILVTASVFGNIKLWNVRSKKFIRSLEIPDTGWSGDDKREKGITSIAFSPDEQNLAIRLRFGRVITWDLSNDQVVEYERTGNARLAVHWHPNGKQFVSTDHYDVSVYDLGKQTSVAKFQQLDSNSICWINETVFATGGADHSIRLWDMSTRAELRSLQIARSPVDVCGTSPDGRYLAARADRQLKIIRLDELLGSRHKTLTPPGKRIDGGWHFVHWSPDGKFIASGHNDARVDLGTYGSTVRIFDVEQNKFVVEYSIRPNPKIDWAADSQWVQVIDSEGRIHALAATEPYVKLTRIPSDESNYFSLKTFNTFTNSAISPQRQLIAFDKLTQEDKSDASSEVWVYDYNDLKIVDTVTVGGGIKSWSPDGKRLCLVEWDNVFLYDALERTCTRKLGLQRAATVIAWNPNSNELAIGSRDGAIHILSDAGSKHGELEGRHRALVNGLDWSPDGTRIASTADDGTLRIWDAVFGDEVSVLRLPVPDNTIAWVDWSPDGRLLAVGTRTGEILVLDAPSMPNAIDKTDLTHPNYVKTVSPIRSAIVAMQASSDRIRIDDFDDGDDAGWIRFSSNHDALKGQTLQDASSGAYRLQTSTNVAAVDLSGVFAAALWSQSSAPTYSNGLIRAKVRVDSQGCLAAIAFRMSGEDYSNGYLFKANTAPRYKHTDFEIQRIKGGKTVQFTKLGTTDLTFNVGEEWWIEAGGMEDQLSMKVWRVGRSEPNAPQLVVVDDTYSMGFFGFASYISAGFARIAQVNATFDDVSFKPLGRLPVVAKE